METDKIVSDLEHARDVYKAAAKDAVGNFFEAVFREHPELDAIFLRGYTPGFNDGDPCVHGMEVHLDADDYGSWDDLSMDEEWSQHLNEETNQKLPGFKPTPPNQYRWQDKTSEFYKINDGINALTDPLEDSFGSNWQCLWVRVDGEVKQFGPEEYDCGY